MAQLLWPDMSFAGCRHAVQKSMMCIWFLSLGCPCVPVVPWLSASLPSGKHAQAAQVRQVPRHAANHQQQQRTHKP